MFQSSTFNKALLSFSASWVKLLLTTKKASGVFQFMFKHHKAFSNWNHDFYASGSLDVSQFHFKLIGHKKYLQWMANIGRPRWMGGPWRSCPIQLMKETQGGGTCSLVDDMKTMMEHTCIWGIREGRWCYPTSCCSWGGATGGAMHSISYT